MTIINFYILKSLKLTFAVAVTFLASFYDSAPWQKANCSITTKSIQELNLKILTAQNIDESLDKTCQLADSSEPYNPPDNGGPKSSQGSGTRNM